MKDCLFCKIVRSEIPCTKVYEDENVIGLKDLYPQALVHVLFIHKKHTQDVTQMPSEQLCDIFSSITKFTSSELLLKDGHRIITNVGKNGGQSVFHTHFHVLGGEKLGRFA